MALTKSQEARAKKSQKYWQDREAEQLKHNITEEKEFEKQLNRVYRDMLEKVENDIYSFYGKYAEKEGITIAEAKKRVLKADIETLERKAKKYVRDAAKDRRANFGETDTEAYYFSEEANEEMRLYNLTMKINRLEMLKANIGIELLDGHSKLEKFMSEILQDRTEAEMERQAGILGKSVQDNAQVAKTIVNASFHNATFSERIWLNQKLLKAEIDKQLQSGLVRGKNPRVLAKDIRKQFDVSKYNAERLMRTELARVQTEAQKESFIRNDFEMYTFHVNSGCCQICSGLNGKHFKIKDMMPGTNAPPMHPNCRCSISAYEDSEEYEAWLDYLDKGGTTEEWEWNAKYVKNNDKTVVKKSGSDIIISGARITDIFSEEAEQFAEMYYEEIRSFSTDAKKIADNLGKKESDIKKIKAYLFEEDSLLDVDTGEKRRFDPDCAIAQSWQRLMIGKNIKPHDRTLIEHELLEMKIKKEHPDIEHWKAHEKATEKYDYPKEALEYYGNLKKHKKDK